MRTNNGSFRSGDVDILLRDITGQIQPTPTNERERLIQSGVHYSEMLPLEQSSSEKYLAEYYSALNEFGTDTARAVANVSELIYREHGRNVALVSLARAGTPVGVLIKRYLSKKYGIDVPHYTISIVRGRGIDKTAMKYILSRHAARDLQFTDGWTGKGAILNELSVAAEDFFPITDRRKLLAVLADPANVTDICGTHEDFPIASSFLNSTVCGLMSRTVMRNGIEPDELHGVVFYSEFAGEDHTYEFIERIESEFDFDSFVKPAAVQGLGIDEVRRIAGDFDAKDINFVKPGIGEATRVLLRRLPDVLLVSETAEERQIRHLLRLAEEKAVPVVRYPLKNYIACGIIKTLSADA